MKGKKIIIFLIIINILLMGFIYVVLNEDIYIVKGKQLIKEMSETEQVTNKENQLNQSNTELLNYKTYIQQSKTNLANAITDAGVDTDGTDSFETMATNIRNISTNTSINPLYFIYIRTSGSTMIELKPMEDNEYFEVTTVGAKITCKKSCTLKIACCVSGVPSSSYGNLYIYKNEGEQIISIRGGTVNSMYDEIFITEGDYLTWKVTGGSEPGGNICFFI